MSNYESRPRLRTGLYLVMTRPRDGYERLCSWAVEAGVAAVQLRTKGHDENKHLAVARRLRALTAGSETLFIVNDRVDIALEADADGLHIGQDDLPAQEARRRLGPHKLLGLSTHNLAQVEQANQCPVDYIGFGPLYATTSKLRPDPIVGPELLEQACKLSHHPVVAIGGLNAERIRQLDHGAHNVAVICAASDADDPLTSMRILETSFFNIPKNR